MASARSDVQLIAAVKKGDLDAFTELVERHQRGLINYFYHHSWDRQISEDCAQEVFVKLFYHIDGYIPRAKFTTFLFRVARNHWIDRMRAKEGDPKVVSLEAPMGSEDGRPLRDRLPVREERPLDRIVRRERGEMLRQAIQKLPEDQREVLVLAELEGLRYQEVGEILGIPVGTVKSRMHAAVGKLKEILSDVELP